MSTKTDLCDPVVPDCAGGNHIAGIAGSRTVLVQSWEQERLRFLELIEDFNVRGQRQQVNHPGWFTRYNFCTECGADLRALTLAPLY